METITISGTVIVASKLRILTVIVITGLFFTGEALLGSPYGKPVPQMVVATTRFCVFQVGVEQHCISRGSQPQGSQVRGCLSLSVKLIVPSQIGGANDGRKTRDLDWRGTDSKRV